MVNFIVIVATVYAVYQILIHFGVFEISVGTSKLTDDIKLERKNNLKRKRERKKLDFYRDVTDYFRGLVMPAHVYEQHKYIVERLDIRSDILDKVLTPEELRGKYTFILITGIVVIPLGVFFPVFWAYTIITLLIFFLYPKQYITKIQDEDKIIDIYFIDLYLLMYSKLRGGSKARLQPVIESYIDTLQTAGDVEMKRVMLKFSKYLLDNLTMYEDHEAVPKLRYRYRSSTVVNFCNVAAQSLQGIDNADTLLTFKMDLVRRKTDVMKANALVLLRKGERSIYLIYLILGIFVLVGWYSKLPTGFF